MDNLRGLVLSEATTTPKVTVLTTDPADGTVFAYAFTTATTPILGKVNLATGAVSQVGPTFLYKIKCE